MFSSTHHTSTHSITPFCCKNQCYIKLTLHAYVRKKFWCLISLILNLVIESIVSGPTNPTHDACILYTRGIICIYCRCNRICGVCNTDYVQVYSVFDRGLWENSVDRLTGQYCGEFLPGPQLSDAAASMLRVLFIANGEETNTGFRAKYEFVKQFGKGQSDML